jgi:phosphohistidine phosphatase
MIRVTKMLLHLADYQPHHGRHTFHDSRTSQRGFPPFNAMKLYLLRHGDAGERSAEGYTTDSARSLSSKGIKRTRQLANTLRQMEITFDVILSSPLIRAQQTAEIVARSLGLEEQLRLTNQLTPDGALSDALALIGGVAPKSEAVLLVGHEPNLGRLISRLCTGGANLGLTLKKGGLCRLELAGVKPGPCATLEWLLSPRHFGPKRPARSK